MCVGPRSAVFAPIEDLGLIVVDEEHDASYKHEGDPRYDARDVAAERARRQRRAAAARQRDAAPGERVHARCRALCAARQARRRAPAAARRACSTCAASRAPGLHPVTAQALADVAPRRGQGDRAAQPPRLVELPLLPLVRARVELPGLRRRARPAPRAAATLACHHCGHREPAPARCEHCGSTSVARHGAGTERVQHDLAAACSTTAALPRLPPRRRHVSAPDERRRRCCAASRRPTAGVLIGTQMVAKGHDFPDVTLGVVLDADATLRFPDFRAEERTFALIAQLAGRVGRGRRAAAVLVQTIAPEARAIAARRPPRQRRLPRRRAASAARRSAIRRSRT